MVPGRGVGRVSGNNGHKKASERDRLQPVPAGGPGYRSQTLLERVQETILTIDRELAIARDAEYREALVKTAYRLRDLSLYIQLHESARVSAPAAKSSRTAVSFRARARIARAKISPAHNPVS